MANLRSLLPLAVILMRRRSKLSRLLFIPAFLLSSMKQFDADNIVPSGCAGPEDERSDEIGIIAAGLGTDGRGYVLADYSGLFAPEAWAERVLFAWETHKADLVIAEKNFGGAMVESVIQSQANARGMLGVKI